MSFLKRHRLHFHPSLKSFSVVRLPSRQILALATSILTSLAFPVSLVPLQLPSCDGIPWNHLLPSAHLRSFYVSYHFCKKDISPPTGHLSLSSGSSLLRGQPWPSCLVDASSSPTVSPVLPPHTSSLPSPLFPYLQIWSPLKVGTLSGLTAAWGPAERSIVK